MSALVFALQDLWSHRAPRYAPTDPVPIEGILRQESWSPREEALLFAETGLSPAALHQLKEKGEEGITQILETQAGYFQALTSRCVPLIGGGFTCEDLLYDEAGEKAYPVPLAPLKAGDLLLSFATHSMGWRHGHAGLVVDPVKGTVLEAVQLGMNSYLAGAKHWRNYSNFLLLRVKEVGESLRRQVADFAKENLNDIPYSLLPGIVSPKEAEIGEGPGVHCAYLPWYAWKKGGGIDLDATGGPIVTVADLAKSPQVEVVQVYGLDPHLVEGHLAT